MFFLQSCSRIILDDKSHSRFLNTVRDPKKDKSMTMKLIVKKCTSMTSNNRSVKCPKCGYMNGRTSKISIICFFFFFGASVIFQGGLSLQLAL